MVELPAKFGKLLNNQIKSSLLFA